MVDYTKEINKDILFKDISNDESIKKYFWDFGDGSTSVDKDVTHKYISNGTYEIVHKVFNDCGDNTCSKTIEITQQKSDNLLLLTLSAFAIGYTLISSKSKISKR